MEKHDGFWHEVGVGSFILGSDGETLWKVVAERPAQPDKRFADGKAPAAVMMEQRDGTRKVFERPDPFKPVVFMFRTLEECEAMVAEKLGATLLARKDAKVYETPAISDKAPLGDIRTHLFLFHGTYTGDVKTRAGLMDCHDDQHRESDAGHTLHAYVLHRHVRNIRPLGARQ